MIIFRGKSHFSLAAKKIFLALTAPRLQADDLQMFDLASLEIKPPSPPYFFWKVFKRHRSSIEMSAVQTSSLLILLCNLFLHYESTATCNSPKSSQVHQYASYLGDGILIRGNIDQRRPLRSALAHSHFPSCITSVQHDPGSSSWQRASQKGQQMVFSLKNSRQRRNRRNYFAVGMCSTCRVRSLKRKIYSEA